MTSLGTSAESATANGKRVGMTGAIVLALLLVLGTFASRASAEPLSMEFTEARANVGEQLFDDTLFQAPGAPFGAQLDVETGAITGGVLEVPHFETSITDPIEADVIVDFEIGEITGIFDRATGALSLTGTAGGTLEAIGEGQCDVSVPGELTLTTGDNSGGANPRSGAPFSNGLAGAGAIAGTWDTMVAEPVTEDDEWFCDNVEDEIDGPGGVWLQHAGDVVPPAAPQLTGTDPASPSRSGTPRIRGAAEAGSNVAIYASANCTGAPVAGGSAAELGSPGIQVGVAEGATATFSAAATDPVGNTSPCSAPIAYTRLNAPVTVPDVKPDVKPKSKRRACKVPKLRGKKLKQAKRKLKAANCKLGKVTKPKNFKAKRGKKRRVLVVKRSTPRRGARPADRKVDLKLGPKRRKAARR
jgi:hypothetical protein